MTRARKRPCESPSRSRYYKRGCRCPGCKAAVAEYQRDRERKRAEKDGRVFGEKPCAKCGDAISVLGANNARRYCEPCAQIALRERQRADRERRAEVRRVYAKEHYEANKPRYAEQAADYRFWHREDLTQQFHERLERIRARHRRKMAAINKRNQLERRQAWETAKAQARGDLLVLIDEQEKDERRNIIGGGHRVVSLDASFVDWGASAHDFYSSFRYDSGPWADPVFDAVVARLEVAERLSEREAS